MLAGLVVGLGLIAGHADVTASISSLPSVPHRLVIKVAAARTVHVNASAMASLVSAFRREHGLGPVMVDPALMRFAQEQARNMAAYNTMGHDVGRPFSERRRSVRARIVVENVGAAYGSVAEAFAGWRDSPSHRANMLDPDMTRLGIAAVATTDSYYKVFWALALASR